MNVINGVIQPADPLGELALSLMRALAAEEAIRYADLGLDDFDSFRPEDVSTLLIAYADGHAVGCGALRQVEPSVAEINRVYVVPASRRRGIARAMLAELERCALRLGCRSIRAETGNRQPQAVSLYEQAGFVRALPFGSHADDPVSIFLEKTLVP